MNRLNFDLTPNPTKAAIKGLKSLTQTKAAFPSQSGWRKDSQVEVVHQSQQLSYALRVQLGGQNEVWSEVSQGMGPGATTQRFASISVIWFFTAPILHGEPSAPEQQ